MSGLSEQRLAEIEARAQLAYDGGDPIQTAGYDVPALIAEIRRLRALLDATNAALDTANRRFQAAEGDRNRVARQLADRADERDAAEAECARLATELGALDADRASLQLAQQDLRAAYDRLGEQAQRIVEAASQFRVERDRLHDALSDLLLGPAGAGWESSGTGDVRSPWIPAGQVAGWRQLLARIERSERDGGEAINDEIRSES